MDSKGDKTCRSTDVRVCIIFRWSCRVGKNWIPVLCPRERKHIGEVSNVPYVKYLLHVRRGWGVGVNLNPCVC